MSTVATLFGVALLTLAGVNLWPPAAGATTAQPAVSPQCAAVGHSLGLDIFAQSGSGGPWQPFQAGLSVLPSGIAVKGGSCYRHNVGINWQFLYLTNAVATYRSIALNLPAHRWRFTREGLPVGLGHGSPSLAAATALTDAQARHDNYISDGWCLPTNTEPTCAAGPDLGVTLVDDGSRPATLYLYLVDSTAATQRPATGFDRKGFISDLKSITNAIPSAKQAATAAGGVVVLSLVIGYPAFLLNKVIEGRFESWRERVRRRWRALAPRRYKLAAWLRLPIAEAATPSAEKWTLPRWALWPVFTLAGILGSVDDPNFGFTLTTLRTIITLTISIAVFNFATWTLTKRVLRRYEPNARADIDVKLASIGILIVSVIVSRLLDFSPGVVFGTVAGLVYAIELGLSRKVVVILTGTAFSAAIAIVAWVGYTLFGLIPGASTNGWLIGITEVFGGITIAGVSAAPLALLPLANLDGASLFRWRRLVWAGTYAVVLFLFIVAMFDLPQSFTAVSGDVIRWLILFGAFAVVAVGVWIVDMELRKRAESREKRGLARVDRVG